MPFGNPMPANTMIIARSSVDPLTNTDRTETRTFVTLLAIYSDKMYFESVFLWLSQASARLDNNPKSFKGSVIRVNSIRDIMCSV